MDPLCSLIIIEDEDQIREGLVQSVNWEEFGFSVAGSFATGEDALQFLQTREVDAVLSDICLGGLSGLEVAGWIYANRPGTRVVLVSGYSDFEYARTAIRYHVNSYLLKPIDYRELHTVFFELYADIRKANREIKKLHSSDAYCLKSFLSLSLQGERIDTSLPLSQELRLAAATQGWLFFRITHPVRSCPEGAGINWDNFSPASDRFCSAAIYHNPHAYVIAVPLTKRSLNESALDFERSAGYALEKLGRENGLIFSVTMSRSFPSIEALQAHLCNFAAEGVAAVSGTLLPSIIKDILSLNPERIRSDFQGLEEEPLRAACYILLSKLLQFEEQYGISTVSTITDLDFQQLSYETGASLRSHADALLQRFEGLLSANSSGIVEKACLYIQECKGRKVSLSEAAERVFVSPSYLSKLFKKQKNMNFKAYVSSVSLDYAKSLLMNTQMKVVDISELLGFRDIRYFYKFFRDGTGKTPSEFRKLYQVEA